MYRLLGQPPLTWSGFLRCYWVSLHLWWHHCGYNGVAFWDGTVLLDSVPGSFPYPNVYRLQLWMDSSLLQFQWQVEWYVTLLECNTAAFERLRWRGHWKEFPVSFSENIPLFSLSGVRKALFRPEEEVYYGDLVVVFWWWWVGEEGGGRNKEPRGANPGGPGGPKSGVTGFPALSWEGVWNKEPPEIQTKWLKIWCSNYL